MSKEISVPNQWTMFSDLYPGTQPSDKFTAQVIEGVVMVACELEKPTTNGHFTFSSKEAGGFTDEWFDVGKDGKIAFIRSASSTPTKIIAEVIYDGKAVIPFSGEAISGLSGSQRVSVYEIEANSVSSGNYDFDIGDIEGSPNLFLDEFRFTNSSGSVVFPSAGTVSVQVSSDGVFWRKLNNGDFAANIDTTSSNYTPPSGLAAVSKLRITLAGVVGASGFKANFVRG
ncbi:hypothetical protein SNE85_000834 [Vibrio cholerae]|nr:hypothetical protein [Vibrio cholerae]